MAYYAKASALLLIGVFGLVMVVRTLVDLAAHRKAAKSSSIDNGQTGRPARTAATATLTIAVFFLVIAPYLLDNQERYGRLFYNVNSTFFFWGDSWQQAKDFADGHNLAESYPDAEAEAIPGPLNYFKTHDLGTALNRTFYGLKTLTGLALAGRYAKYLIAAFVVCLWLGRYRIRRIRALETSNGLVALFCALLLLGYLSVYAWYAVVAHGDRFLLSLYLPALCAALWGIERFDGTASPIVVRGRRWRPAGVFATVMVVLLLAEGVWLATRGLYRPTENFVRFYFNESRERERLGDIEEAVRGYRGVIELRPSFAPAHHELGMVALRMGASTWRQNRCGRPPRSAPMMPTYSIAMARCSPRPGNSMRRSTCFSERQCSIRPFRWLGSTSGVHSSRVAIWRRPKTSNDAFASWNLTSPGSWRSCGRRNRTSGEIVSLGATWYSDMRDLMRGMGKSRRGGTTCHTPAAWGSGMNTRRCGRPIVDRMRRYVHNEPQLKEER